MSVVLQAGKRNPSTFVCISNTRIHFSRILKILLNVTVSKCPTGIVGFDEVTWGGRPQGRTTLVNGVRTWNAPGIFAAFEEDSCRIVENTAKFDWALSAQRGCRAHPTFGRAPLKPAPIFGFRLYVDGDSPNSTLAQANLQQLCLAHLPDRHPIAA